MLSQTKHVTFATFACRSEPIVFSPFFFVHQIRWNVQQRTSQLASFIENEATRRLFFSNGFMHSILLYLCVCVCVCFADNSTLFLVRIYFVNCISNDNNITFYFCSSSGAGPIFQKNGVCLCRQPATFICIWIRKKVLYSVWIDDFTFKYAGGLFFITFSSQSTTRNGLFSTFGSGQFSM